MAELVELYQSIIIDHNRTPRHYGKGGAGAVSAEGYNPTCGDQVTIHYKIRAEVFADLAFEAASCAVAKASASLMCTHLQGASISRFEHLFSEIRRLLEADDNSNRQRFSGLGELEALAGVKAFPARKSCALLPWKTLQRSLADQSSDSTFDVDEN